MIRPFILYVKKSREKYPKVLRRIKYYDSETDCMYIFITNNFSISSQMVADLYKHRWQIELFFKWIKQHLKIKVFWGRSSNAVKTQLCIALCTYLIIAILKKKLSLKQDMYEILQVISISLFDKTPIAQLFSETGIQSVSDDTQNTLPLEGF